VARVGASDDEVRFSAGTVHVDGPIVAHNLCVELQDLGQDLHEVEVLAGTGEVSDATGQLFCTASCFFTKCFWVRGCSSACCMSES
jgi:hypothetical protein